MTAETLRTSSVSGTMIARVCILAGGLIDGHRHRARTRTAWAAAQYFAVTTAAAIVAQVANFGLTSSNVFLGARDRTPHPAAAGQQRTAVVAGGAAVRVAS